MTKKQHENPEFQVVMQNEANAKFFVASFGIQPKSNIYESPETDAVNVTSKIDFNANF